MRLISIHIENFGKISNLDFVAEEGLNVVCAENGWGKTTLVTFIRVMFYGFKDEGKRAKERDRLRPWQGGTFGGRICFEAKGRRYVLTRTFGDKPDKDFFELRDMDTNMVVDDYSTNIGREMFGVDMASFERTVYLGQGDISCETTDDINAKIGNLTENSGDMNSFERADAVLTDYLNKNSPRRATGSIRKKIDRKSALETEISKGAGIENSIEAVNRQIAAHKENLDKLRSEREANDILLKKLAAIKDAKAIYEMYDKLSRDAEVAQTKLNATSAYFPGRVPASKEIADISVHADNAQRSEGKAGAYAYSAEESAEYARWSQVFAKKVPDYDRLRQIKDKEIELRRMRSESAGLQLSAEDAEKLAKYREEFGQSADPRAEARDTENLWNEIVNRSREQTNRLAASKTLLMQKKRKRILVSGLLMLAGVICIIAGLLLTKKVPANYDEMFNWLKSDIYREQPAMKSLPNVLLIVIGAVAVLAGLICTILAGRTKLPESMSLEIEKDEAFIKEGIAKVENYLLSHITYSDADRNMSDYKREGKAVITSDYEEVGRDVTSTDYVAVAENAWDNKKVSDAINDISDRIVRYISLSERDEIAKTSARGADCESLSREISDFISEYAMTADENEYASVVFKLEEGMKAFLRLSEQKQNYDRAKSYVASERKIVHDFLNAANIMPREDLTTQLDELLAKAAEVEHLIADYRKCEQERAAYAESHDVWGAQNVMKEAVTESGAYSGNDMTALSEQISDIDKEIDQIKEYIKTEETNLEGLYKLADELADVRSEYEELSETISDDKRKYANVTKAQEYLRKAKDQLTAKYTKPILDSFTKYYSAVSDKSAENYHLDAGINLTFDEAGIQRPTGSLSQGYRDVVGLCLRVALADAMYDSEFPMLLMDDPFVNLDDSKIQGAKELLKAIENKYQIIYFTCSESRK